MTKEVYEKVLVAFLTCKISKEKKSMYKYGDDCSTFLCSKTLQMKATKLPI